MAIMKTLLCKLLIAIIATTIILSIFIKYATNIDNRKRPLDSIEARKIHYKDSPFSAYQGLFLVSDAEMPMAKIVVGNESQEQHSLQNVAPSKLALTATKASCEYTNTCGFSCSGGTIEDTVISINALIEEGNKCNSTQYWSLTITRTMFTNNTIRTGWLQEVSIAIRDLKMVSIDFEDLGESLFSGKPFGTSSNPMNLALSNTAIRVLAKSMFKGSSISSLQISFDAMSTGIHIEEDVFGETSSIHTIVLQYCLTSAEALKNLTGRGNVLVGLQTLILSYNTISTLENGAFSKAPNLQQLFLVSSGLFEIESGAFQGLFQVIQLHLTNNHLQTLPEGLFDDMTVLQSIYTSNNPWHCDCDLEWFKKYLSTMPASDSRECKIGSDFVDMEQVDFCPANSSTSSTSKVVTTTTVSSITSTETLSTFSPDTTPVTVTTNKPSSSDFLYEKIMCRSLLTYSFDSAGDDEKYVWYESIFKRRKINYTFSEIEDTQVFVLDLLADMRPEDFLIWTNVADRSDYGCVFNITSNISMKLQYDETYTLCLCSNDTTDTYALIANDCSAIATPPDWAHRAWLVNAHKTAIILSTILTFLITVTAAAASVYYLVKHYPELIKGNKRVLIVKRGSYSPKVLVMPSKKNRHVSLCTNNEGYLTPKLKHWFRRSKSLDMRYQELETITDGYSFMENTCNDVIDKNIYEPPPVPPNHPTRRRDSGRPYFYSNI